MVTRSVESVVAFGVEVRRQRTGTEHDERCDAGSRSPKLSPAPWMRSWVTHCAVKEIGHGLGHV